MMLGTTSVSWPICKLTNLWLGNLQVDICELCSKCFDLVNYNCVIYLFVLYFCHLSYGPLPCGGIMFLTFPYICACVHLHRVGAFPTGCHWLRVKLFTACNKNVAVYFTDWPLVIFYLEVCFTHVLLRPHAAILPGHVASQPTDHPPMH